MKYTLLAVAMFATIAVVSAQHPRHCVAPLEFEAHAFQMAPKEEFFRRGHFAYDARNERTSLFEDEHNGTDHEFYHTIELFRERKAFRFNLKTKVCTVQEIKHRFHRIEVPRNASFVGEAIIGTNAFENSGMLPPTWAPTHYATPWAWFGVSPPRAAGCVPIQDDFHDHNVGRVQTNFFDVVLGISDPNVFIPESSCPRARVHKH